jgi:TonB-linked SusC/RagA family outer membrane protein
MKNISLNKGLAALWYPLIFSFYLFCTPALARNTLQFSVSQQQTITGTITDGTAPLVGVTIKLKGTTTTVVSDFDGKYSIAAQTTDALIFSYLGYKTIEITVGNRKIIDVKMLDDTTSLREVTVNAGYYSVKEKERTGSIAKITSKDIEKQPVNNVLATMQGRMAGVNITQNTGMPGGGFNIEIRGQNSLRLDGSNPLYIIDGVPYSSQDIGSGYTSGNIPGQNNPLNSINPGDIANIEVLKDADATAIYGSRGANGVVLITTKKGKEGKTVFTTTYSNGFGQVAHFMNLMKTPEYLAMRREAFANDGVTNYPADAYDVNGTWDQTRNTDWQKEIIGGTATYTNVQSSLSGGSAQTQFLLSGNYNKETTVFLGDFDYIKANGHLNVNHESENKKFKISFTTGYTAQFNTLPSIDLTRDALTLVPNAPSLYDASGNLNWENNTFDNPMAKLEGKIKGETYDFLANTLLSYELGLGFIAKASLGYTDLRQEQLNLLPSTIYNPSYGLGSEVSSVFTNTLNRSSWIIEPQLGWSHTVGKGKIEVLAGSTFQKQKGDQLVSVSEGFASNSLMENPASAAFYLILNSDENVYKYQAFFGRVNLNWKSKYLLNLTGRRDGSTRFGPGRQFATFGAIGAAWVFGEEDLIKEKLSFLSFGKLRASYGTSGNDQIGDYQYLDTYSTSGYTYQGIGGIQPTRLFNPDFGWETNRKLELALETGFLNDRIFSTVAWFRNRSSNQLVGIPLPGTTGFNSLQANLDAEVQNSGLELSLRTVNIKQKNFSWTTNFNLTSTKNKLLSFPGLEASSYKNQYVIGQPVNIVKVYHYTGLDANTGVYQFEDVNGDGTLSASDDKKTIKDLSPKYYGGLQNQFRYGNLQLDFLFQFVKQLNFNENYRTSMPGTMVNQPAGVTQHWQNPGDEGPYQAYSDSNATLRAASTRFSQSDAAISDASYVRLKNVSLSFDLPQSWTKKFTCKLSLQGQNILTITSYKGIDPEFRSSGYLPPLRIYTTSIQITF